ncbi:MAG: DsrE/DsrF/DrsH-like family protein [Actinomycetota bacterium]
MNDQNDTLSVILFSGTDDKLGAAAVLVSGAAAMGRRVDILLQYWALEAFRAGATRKDHGVSPEGGPEGAAALARLADKGAQHWSDLFAVAKDVGEVAIHACAQSMELFGLEKSDLDPIVDDVEGVAAFILEAEGQMVFI